MIKILHVNIGLSLGGGNRALFAVAKYSSQMGDFEHRLAVLPPAPDEKAVKLAQEAGVSVIEIPDKKSLYPEIEKADIVQFNWWNSPAIYELLHADDLPEMRLAIWCHVAGNQPPQIITENIMNFADVALACNPYSYELPVFQDLPEKERLENTGMVLGATDFERIAGIRRKSHKGFNIGYIGTVDFVKMHPRYVAMSAAIDIPEAKFIVCGTGSFDILKEQIQQVSADERFDLRGYVSDISPVLQILDVFGYPLTEDTFAGSELTLQETMYLGIPPVVFPHGGIRRLVEHEKTGMVVNSEKEYKEAVEYLYHHPEERKRLGNNARKHARSEFGGENAARAINPIYERLIKSPKRKRVWGIPPGRQLLNRPLSLQEILQKPVRKQYNGAQTFIESLGSHGKNFHISMHSDNIDECMKAESEIANVSLLMRSSGAGGIIQYRNYYPNDGHLKLWAGLIRQQEGIHPDAIANFLEAIRLGVDHWRVYWYLAQSAEQIGDQATAVKALQIVVQKAPRFDDARRMLQRLSPQSMPQQPQQVVHTPPPPTSQSSLDRINTLIAQKDFEGANEALTQALLYNPDDPQLIVIKGTLYLQQEDIEKARREFVKATVLAPRFALGHSMLGLVLIYMERYRQAEQSLQRALELNPEDDNTKTLLQGTREKLQQKAPQVQYDSAANERMKVFNSWISALAIADRRLYYRDQTPESLNALVEMVHTYKPDRVVELGTLSGLSLRTWLMADEHLKVTAIDLSFKALIESQKIVPLDLSRVTCIEKDIMTIDFSSLWSKNERVLFYIDAHDLPGVPIMDQVLYNALPFLAPGSIVAVDDLWYSPTTLNDANALEFYDRVVVPQYDPIYYAVLNYAPYWEQGSFVGYPEVIPFMKWLAQNNTHITIKPKVKMVYFEYPLPAGKAAVTRPFSQVVFQSQVGQVMRNPVAAFQVHDQHLPQAQQALAWCRNGAQAFEKGHVGETFSSFERALSMHQAISGAFYAQAVCLARQGQYDASLQYLQVELNRPYPPHPKALILQNDIKEWLAMEKKGIPITQPQKTGSDLTIFASPKPFRDLAGIIQRNAITSWSKLSPKPDIILFGEEEGNQQISRELGLIHHIDIQRTQFNTPLVSDLFNKAQQIAKSRTCMYTNADIIFLSNLQATIDKVREKFDHFLIVGQRWDIELPHHLNFDAGWKEELQKKVSQDGTIHSPAGIDYFIFSCGAPFVDLPPFVLGRPAWDNWLIYHAMKSNIPVIDATEEIMAIHQNHDYSHSKGAKSGPEVDHNRQLAQGYASVLSSTDATWCFIDGRLQESPYAFSEIVRNQTSQSEFAARLLKQGEYFNQHGKYARAISCLEEAKRNHASFEEVENAFSIARTGLQRKASVTTQANQPLVSVVIPTFNRGHLIQRAVQSLQQQTYRNIEIIVVDDASTDDTEKIVNEIARNDERVKYTRHLTNRGAQSARNSGIRAAMGEWITFLDSDDEYLPQKIEKQIDTAFRENVPVVYCECYQQEGGIETRTLLKTRRFTGNIYAEALKGSPITFPSLFVKKSCFDQIDYLDEYVPSFQELDTTIRLARHFEFGFVPEPLFIYYRNVPSAISDNLQGNAAGWEYIVNKHADEIRRVTGVETLGAHYQEIKRRYSLAGMPEKVSQYQTEIQKLFQPVPQTTDISPAGSQNANQLVQQGIQQYRNGNLNAAENTFKQAQHLAPADTNIMVSLGMIYLDSQRFQNALDQFMEAVKADAADVDAWIGLSKAARVFNNQRLLSRSLEMVRMLDPGNPELDKIL